MQQNTVQDVFSNIVTEPITRPSSQKGTLLRRIDLMARHPEQTSVLYIHSML